MMYLRIIPVVYCLLLKLPAFIQEEQHHDSEIAEQLCILLFLMCYIISVVFSLIHSTDIKLFKLQRAEQLEAIKNFKKITKYEKQYSMITLMAEKVFTTIQNSRATIEASSYIPGVSPFPEEEFVKDALSNILENTALFSEIILRFPDIAVSVLKTNNNWDVLLQWSIAFCNQVKYLLDKSTIKLLHLVSQELNHVERELNYVNPYRKNQIKVEEEGEPHTSNQKKRKKKEIKKGPRLTSHIEL